MDQFTKTVVWGQFGAAIDALENAINQCPDANWDGPVAREKIWYWASHTLFWLDYYLTPDPKDYQPREPFGMHEMDPAGGLPPQVYTRGELLDYLEHGRRKCRETILSMTDETARMPRDFGKSGTMPFAELILYNLRHVQHHTAQLNLLLRQQTDSAPGWTFTARQSLDG